jgi:multidrug resistance protein
MNPARKWAIVGLTSMGSFCVTCASSIYTSTYTQMNAEFGCSRIVATLGLSMFVLGIALGPMWSPLSEFYGRRPIYLASFAVFTVWIVPTAVARNIGTVIVSRFFQGLSGSAFLSVSGGTVGDLFTPNKMHYPMIMFTAAPFLGPSFGPMIGGFINSNVNWRWTHYMLIIWAFLMCLALVVTVPETYREFDRDPQQGTARSILILTVVLDPVVLRNKARKIRKDTGHERWKAPIEKTNKSLFRTVGVSLMRPFQILIFEPMALVLNLYSAILLGILYLFFGAFPLVFQGTYGFNLWQTGLTFLGMLVGMFFAALMGPLWVKIRAQLIEKNEKVTGIEGKAEPEYRLPSAILGSFLVTIGLFWFGWASFPWVHWIMPIIGSGIFGAGVSPSLSHFLLYDHLLWHNGGLFV